MSPAVMGSLPITYSPKGTEEAPLPRAGLLHFERWLAFFFGF